MVREFVRNPCSKYYRGADKLEGIRRCDGNSGESDYGGILVNPGTAELYKPPGKHLFEAITWI